MDKKSRRRCQLYFLICFVLEATGLALILYTFTTPTMSSCILGGEVYLLAFIYLLTVVAYVVPDLIFLLCSLLMNTVGEDPVSIVYNFIAAILCIVSGVALLLELLLFCGSIGQILQYVAGILNVIAGIVHLQSSKKSHDELAPDEKEWPAKRPSRPKAPKQKKKKSKECKP